MASDEVTVRIGEVIVNEGERSSDLYILLSGKVAVFKGIHKVAELDNPGTVIGEMSFFLGEQRSATLVAMSEVLMQKVSKSKLADFFSTNPEFAIKVASSLADKLNDTTQKVETLQSIKSKYERMQELAKNNTELQRIINDVTAAHTKSAEKIKDLLNQQSMMSQKVVEPFVGSTLDTVQSFLQTTGTKDTPFEFGTQRVQMDAASLVNILGDLQGWYVLGFPKATALSMTSKLTGGTYSDFTDDVVNFIKEFNNIIIGIVVSAMSEYKLTISTPTTVFGSETIRNMASKSPSIVIPFDTEFGKFYSIIYIEIVK